MGEKDFYGWPASTSWESVVPVFLDLQEPDQQTVKTYLEEHLEQARVEIADAAAIARQLASGKPHFGSLHLPLVIVTDREKPGLERFRGDVSTGRPILLIATRDSSDTPAAEGEESGLIYRLQSDTRRELAPRIADAIKLAIYPYLMESLQYSMEDQVEMSGLIKHIGKELSTFYHDFNNPLTVLSGNIQLLQILAETMHVPPDIAKPIQDINGISSRFIHDLEIIQELKERIRDLEI
jgi:signal transduction histidine kinase